EVGGLTEAYILGDYVWPEMEPDRFAGLMFKIVITEANGFRASVVDAQLAEANRRGAGLNAGIVRWCETGRADYVAGPDRNSDTVICRDPDEPRGSLFNP